MQCWAEGRHWTEGPLRYTCRWPGLRAGYSIQDLARPCCALRGLWVVSSPAPSCIPWSAQRCTSGSGPAGLCFTSEHQAVFQQAVPARTAVRRRGRQVGPAHTQHRPPRSRPSGGHGRVFRTGTFCIPDCDGLSLESASPLDFLWVVMGKGHPGPPGCLWRSVSWPHWPHVVCCVLTALPWELCCLEAPGCCPPEDMAATLFLTRQVQKADRYEAKHFHVNQARQCRRHDVWVPGLL